MKFIILLAIVVVAVFLLFHFFGNIGTPLGSGGPSSSSSSKQVVPLPQKAPSTATSSVPPGFRGPVGQPHIIGPSGPPPNY